MKALLCQVRDCISRGRDLKAALSVSNEHRDPLVNLGGSVAWSPPSAFVQSTRKYEPAENSVVRETRL